jgi:hypothetical protein
VFATPNRSSYPAAHACPSISLTRALSYLFPRDVEALANRAFGPAFITAATSSRGVN